jgi:hypothetical protein
MNYSEADTIMARQSAQSFISTYSLVSGITSMQDNTILVVYMHVNACNYISVRKVSTCAT